MIEVRQRQVLAEDHLEVARRVRDPERYRLRRQARLREIGGHVELEVARDARHSNDVGYQHLAGCEGRDVEGDLQAEGEPDRVGIGNEQVIGLAVGDGGVVLVVSATGGWWDTAAR